MRQYKEDDSPCGFYVGANPGKFRSPEEYSYKEEDEMIDVYSMGNIFYAILTGEYRNAFVGSCCSLTNLFRLNRCT